MRKAYYAVTLPLRSQSFLPVGLRVNKDGWLSGRVTPSKVDPARWTDPPHVFLANLELNSTDETLMFTRRYGLLNDDEDLTDKNEWLHMDEGNFSCSIAEYTRMLKICQMTLRGAWRGDKDDVATMRGHTVGFPGNTRGNLPIEIHSQGNKIEAVTRDLWTFFCILFTRDHAEGRLKICANPGCSAAPYFVANRRGQSYCRHKCAVLINIHRFRQRQRAQRREKKKAQPRKRRRTQR